MLRQLGQAMVEYTIVTAAFVTGLLVLNNGACPSQYEDCIEYLLTTMHDNSDGYSNSITAVQDYGKSFPVATGPGWPVENPGGGGDDGSGGGSNTGEDGINQTIMLTDSLGFESYGVLEGNNVVDAKGNIVGTYNSDTGFYVPINGGAPVAVVEQRVVRDEAGNILQMQAAVECSTGKVYGFGYKSKVSNKFANSVNLEPVDATNYCFAPAYDVVDRQGKAVEGRIVNGFYYAVGATASLTPTEPVAEVVYWPELNDCAVMVTGWDSGIDPELSDEERYAEQILLYGDTNPVTSPYLGRLSSTSYSKHLVDGQLEWPNDCVSSRTVSAP